MRCPLITTSVASIEDLAGIVRAGDALAAKAVAQEEAAFAGWRLRDEFQRFDFHQARKIFKLAHSGSPVASSI